MRNSSYREIGGSRMLGMAILTDNIQVLLTQEHNMKNSFTPRRALIAAVIGVMLAASGCNKYTDSGQTVGQKLDGAIDKTNAKIAAANDKVGEKVSAAGAAVASASEAISNKTGAALEKAGTAVSTKVDQVGNIVEDSTITASIKTDLLKDPGLSALGIDVNTVKGEVTLKGAVSTDVRKQRAESIATNIVGVTKVNNLLKVTGS